MAPDSVEVRSRVGDATVQPRAIVGQSEVYAASPPLRVSQSSS